MTIRRADGLLAMATGGMLASACGATPAGLPDPVVVFVETNGGGSIVVPSRGLECRSLCVIEAVPGETLELIADPDDGNDFLGWSGRCSGGPTCAMLASDGTRTAAVFRGPEGPEYVWSTQMTMGSDIVGLDVVADGGVSLVGDYFGTVVFGNSAITAPPERVDGFLARMRPDAEPAWIHRLNSGESLQPTVGTTDNLSRTAVFGHGQDLDFGQGPVSPGGVVAGYDAAGNYLWSDFLDGSVFGARDASWTNSDTVVVGGSFAGESLHFNGITIPGRPAGEAGFSGFVLEYAANGTPLWATSLQPVDVDETLLEKISVSTVQPTPDVGLLVVGTFQGGMRVGDEEIFTEGDDADAFVVRFDADRNVLWTRTLQGAGSSAGIDIVIDGDGTLLLLATFSGELTLGGDTIESGDAATTAIVRFSASGTPLTATTYGGDGEGNVYGTAFAPTQDGGYIVVASFNGTTEARLGSLWSPDEHVYPSYDADILLFALNEALEPTWSRRYGGFGREHSAHVATTPDGDVIVGFAAEGDGPAPLRRSDAVQVGFELEEFIAEGLEPKDTTGLVIFRLRP